LDIRYRWEHNWRRRGSWRRWRCCNKCKIGSRLRLIISITGLPIWTSERDENQIIFIDHVWSVGYREIEDRQAIASSCCDLSISITVGPFNSCLRISSSHTNRIAIYIVNEVSVHRDLTPWIEGWCGVSGPSAAQIGGDSRCWGRVIIKANSNSNLWIS